MKADRRLPTSVVAVLLVAGCAVGVNPMPTRITSMSPAPVATATRTPTSTASASRSAGTWREVPEQPSVSGVQFQDVVWIGTRFVAVGTGLDGTGAFLDSADGVAWHRQTGKHADWSPMRLAAGPGGVMAVGSIGERPANWLSSDGLAWTAGPNAFPAPALGADAVQVTDIVATADGWLAVGRRDPPCQTGCGLTPVSAYAWTSSDGSRWTRVSDQRSLKGGGMVAVARGDDGFVAAGTGSEHAAIWTSRDGLVWSRVDDDAIFGGGDVAAGSPPVSATGVAARNGVVVVVGMVFGDPPGVRAWWSASGQAWSPASVEKSTGGQVFSVAATPDGFLATGPSGGVSCLGGIWASTDGGLWRCDASDPRFEGFGPYATAASDAVEVAVGLTSARQDEDSPLGVPGAVWLRTTR